MTPARWTTQQVLGLAPDKGSVAAARRLTSPRTWSQLGATESLVFGRCQGSAKAPYQVTVDLTGPAFKCTCPSRKFPCKHGLALLLLWVEHGDLVGEAANAADFADEWASERRAKAEAKATKAAKAANRPAEVVDPEARARRQAEREAAMTAGLDELEQWLGDLVRQGLAGARRQPYAFWDSMAARLVDAQLPALADRVREVGGGVAIAGRHDWADTLLAECGRWQLAIHAWRRRATLGPATVGDLRTFLGWPRRANEVAAFERVRDRWVVAGVRQGENDRIASQRTWLWGQRTGRWVVLLDFAAAGAVLKVAQVAGSVVDDAVVVHPGSDPVRAALSGEERVVDRHTAPPGLRIAQAVDQLATWLAANPWRDRFPVALGGVVLVPGDGGRWWFQDEAGDRLPLSPYVEPWLVLALSAGTPATVTAEWERGVVYPMVVTPAAAEPVPV
ncbi:MAG: SWIM zinc finger family protein [Acidimicrobiales bacterium]